MAWLKRKFSIVFVCLFFVNQNIPAQTIHSYNFTDLYQTIAEADKYDAILSHSIDSVYLLLKSTPSSDLSKQYKLSAALFDLYKVYKYDSAYYYAKRCQQIAYKSGDKEKINDSRLQVCFTLLSSGLFKETGDSINIISVNQLKTNAEKQEYYTLQARYNYDLADYAHDNYFTNYYNHLASSYVDSLLALCTPESFYFGYYKGLMAIRMGKNEEATVCFTKLLTANNLTNHELAILTSTFCDIYIKNGNVDSAVALLKQAAIADIKSSTKETSALFTLSQLLYKEGDIDNASNFIRHANDDAKFYGSRQRKVQLISILPLIEAEKLKQVESQKKALIGYSSVITLLLLAVIILAVIVNKQVKKLKEAQIIISEANKKQQEINEELSITNAKMSELNQREQEVNKALGVINEKLSSVNNKLFESNRIKEDYIGFFFSTNTDFFNRIDRFKLLAEGKIRERNLEGIKYLINNIDTRKEKEDLLRNFDKAFLKIFPNFIEDFNQLFEPEDRIVLLDNEILNTNLRIFALIRMGVHDISKIAQILEYSVNSINTYKTKVKNKSLIPNDKFEQRVMQIQSVNQG